MTRPSDPCSPHGWGEAPGTVDSKVQQCGIFCLKKLKQRGKGDTVVSYWSIATYPQDSTGRERWGRISGRVQVGWGGPADPGWVCSVSAGKLRLSDPSRGLLSSSRSWAALPSLLGGWPACGLSVVTAEDPEGKQKHMRPCKAESRHNIACTDTCPAPSPGRGLDKGYPRHRMYLSEIHPRHGLLGGHL